MDTIENNKVPHTFKIYATLADEVLVYTVEADSSSTAVLAVSNLAGNPQVFRAEDLGPPVDNVIVVDFKARKRVAA